LIIGPSGEGRSPFVGHKDMEQLLEKSEKQYKGIGNAKIN
jgi:hypothetical protein